MSASPCLAPCLVAIARIIGTRSRVEMRWVDARRIVAGMTDDLPVNAPSAEYY